jgi:hypothetical protein
VKRRLKQLFLPATLPKVKFAQNPATSCRHLANNTVHSTTADIAQQQENQQLYITSNKEPQQMRQSPCHNPAGLCMWLNPDVG